MPIIFDFLFLVSIVAAVAVPHLAVCEDHHLVHLHIFLYQPLDDFVAIGAITYFTFASMHLKGVGKYVVLREVNYFPNIAEKATNNALALALL